MGMMVFGDSGYDKALKKAEDPHMTLKDNPLYDGTTCQQCDTVHRNMHRLEQDARMRRGPNGNVYAGIMSARYKEN